MGSNSGNLMSYSDTATLQKPGLLANTDKYASENGGNVSASMKKKPQNAKKKAPKKRIGKY